MNLQFWIALALAPALAGAQPLASLVDEALHNNREILAAQKKYEAARQRPSQAGSAARSHGFARLYVQRLALPGGRHRAATSPATPA